MQGSGHWTQTWLRKKCSRRRVWAKRPGFGLDEQIAPGPASRQQIKVSLPSTGSRHGRNPGDLSPSPSPMFTDGKPHHYWSHLWTLPAHRLLWQTFYNLVQRSPPYPQGVHSKTPSGYLKPQIVPDPIDTMFFSIHPYTFQLLFGISELPASLPLHFEAVIKEVRVTWTQARRHYGSQSDNQHHYLVTSRWEVSTTCRQWTKGWFTALGQTEQDDARFHHAT